MLVTTKIFTSMLRCHSTMILMNKIINFYNTKIILSKKTSGCFRCDSYQKSNIWRFGIDIIFGM